MEVEKYGFNRRNSAENMEKIKLLRAALMVDVILVGKKRYRLCYTLILVTY